MTTQNQLTASSLARLVGCFTEQELSELAGVKPATVDAWRRRGTGPTYTRFGSSFLYPIESVKSFLISTAKSRSGYDPALGMI